MNKKTLTPIILAGVFFLMLGLSFAAVPLYDLFCRVTGFGGTTQNAENKEIPKIIINQDYKIRFDTNSNGALDWKFYPEKNTINLKPGETKHKGTSIMLNLVGEENHFGKVYYENLDKWIYPKEVLENNGRINIELFK